MFQFDEQAINIVDKYKDLGTILDEHLDFNITASILYAASGRTLSGVISEFIYFRNVGLDTFDTFTVSVVPIN